MPQPAQVIDGRHVDPHKLMKLLQSVYGTSEDGKVKFKVEVRTLRSLVRAVLLRLTRPNFRS
jgi:hypothetical protein